MRDMNNQQLVLLVILVSFVVSIATSISTVSLLEEAPQVITQTINRVIEKVVSDPNPPPAVSPVQPQEIKVVVKEDDLIQKAVQKNLTRTGTLFFRSHEVASETKIESGTVFFAGEERVALTDHLLLPPQADFFISDGAVDRAVELVYEDKEIGLVVLTPKDTKTSFQSEPVMFASQPPVPGQTVIAITGRKERKIEKGIVSHIETELSDDGAEKIIMKIHTNISLLEEDAGGILMNVDGEVIGMIRVSAGGAVFALPVQFLRNALFAYKEQLRVRETGNVAPDEQ